MLLSRMHLRTLQDRLLRMWLGSRDDAHPFKSYRKRDRPQWTFARAKERARAGLATCFRLKMDYLSVTSTVCVLPVSTFSSQSRARAKEARRTKGSVRHMRNALSGLWRLTPRLKHGDACPSRMPLRENLSRSAMDASEGVRQDIFVNDRRSRFYCTSLTSCYSVCSQRRCGKLSATKNQFTCTAFVNDELR